MTATIIMPEAPLLGMPPETKQAGQRVDFRPDKFDIAIETKGFLLMWERAARCPCSPVVEQTEQVNPNCPLCKGIGWIYFGSEQDLPAVGYYLDDLQAKMVADSAGGMVIRGLVMNVMNSQDPADVMGNWVSGDSRLTVRYGNAIGFYDRITALDSSIIYAEILPATGTGDLVLRYPATRVNLIRSLETVYSNAADYRLEAGIVKWTDQSIPQKGLRLSVQYLCHPRWLVMDHPHSIRHTQLRHKVPIPITPTGNPMGLPIQCHIRYEFLVNG